MSEIEDQIRAGLRLVADEVQPSAHARGRLGGRSTRLGAAFAAASICSAATVLALTGSFSSGGATSSTPSEGSTGSHGLEAPGNPIELTFHRQRGTLKSLDVTVGSQIANASMEIQVIHFGPTQLAHPAHGVGATGADGPTGGNASAGGTLVYEKQVSGTPPRPFLGPTGGIGGPKIPAWAKVTGASIWSGTLYPSDWEGGCEAGRYWIHVVAVGPGTSLSDALDGKTLDREIFGGGGFSCK